MEPRVLLDGGAFLEGPRWREDRLWLSDMHGGQIMTVDMDGEVAVFASVPQRPSGLGWLPDGRMLAVSMGDRKVLRMESSGFVEHADLSGLAPFECNDMVVDRRGRAYVGHFGFDHFSHAGFQPASLIAVETDGSARVVADDLMFPNGTVISDDGRTLIVSESYGRRLTAFDIERDGFLSNRRVWADIGMAPDGICLDAERCVWVASPTERALVRVRQGGVITRRIEVGRKAIACMLGGPDRRTLFALTSETTQPDRALELRSARVETFAVDVPGAGLP
ncbi:MAG: SMP-30/gluconolactonase/LRE family protein [Bryobacterales bacterium]|nr:SMP-30/gluconolactonase/LRE family protein [Bryobacterales bacterium]MDE0620480.1 SMP-30/gluconolactonase/LRE family protein [Bryobacterales bacterium]